MKLTRGRTWKSVLRPLLVVLAMSATGVGWNFLTANFATVVDGQIYRSAQMRPSGLGRTVRDHKIKTVLNLRGHHPEQSWYRGERTETLAAGATQVDIALSSSEWMSRTQLRTLVDVLQTCDTPVLIHCWRGAERTGLVSAFAMLLREGSTLADARAQFSLRYLFVRVGDGVVTIEHLEQYENWLARQHLAHAPAVFRRWVAEGFVPGVPNREQWRYDPYPLVVVTRPTTAGAEERKIWDERGRLPATAQRPGESAAVR